MSAHPPLRTRSGDESETTVDEFGVVHHHHVFHDDEEEPEYQEIEPKYKVTDRVMFRHRLVGVGMVHACGNIIQMKTQWIEDEETGEQHKVRSRVELSMKGARKLLLTTTDVCWYPLSLNCPARGASHTASRAE